MLKILPTIFFNCSPKVFTIVITITTMPSCFRILLCYPDIPFTIDFVYMTIYCKHISNKNPAMKSSASTSMQDIGCNMLFSRYDISHISHPFILLYHILFFCKQIISFSTNLYTYQSHQRNLLLFQKVFLLLSVKPFLLIAQ